MACIKTAFFFHQAAQVLVLLENRRFGGQGRKRCVLRLFCAAFGEFSPGGQPSGTFESRLLDAWIRHPGEGTGNCLARRGFTAASTGWSSERMITPSPAEAGQALPDSIGKDPAGAGRGNHHGGSLNAWTRKGGLGSLPHFFHIWYNVVIGSRLSGKEIGRAHV